MDENRTDNTNYEPNFIMTDPDESGAGSWQAGLLVLMRH